MNRKELTFVLRFKSDAKRALAGISGGFRKLGTVVNQASKGFTRLSKSIEKTRKDLVKSAKAARETGRALKDIGSKITTRLTLPLAAAAGGILAVAGGFERSLNTVRNVSGATQEQFVRIREEAARLGAETAFTASQAADGFVILSRAGLTVEQQMGAVGPALNLAAANSIGLAEAAGITTNVLFGFGREISQLPESVDVLTRAAQLANTTVDQLGNAFSFVGPIAASREQDFNEVTAALGALANAGFDGTRAGTGLARILNKLVVEAGPGADKIKELGIEVFDSEGKMRSFVDILEQFEKVQLRAGDAIVLFGERGGPAFESLLRRGSDELRRLTGELDNAGGTAQRAADVQLEGLIGALLKLKSAIEAFAIELAQSGIIQFFTELITTITGFVRSLRELSPTAFKIITIFGIFVAALGPVLVLIGSLIGSLSLLSLALAGGAGLGAALTAIIATFKGLAIVLATNPFTLTLIAVTGIVLALREFLDVQISVGEESTTLRAILVGAWDAIKTALGLLTDAIKLAFNFYSEGAADTATSIRKSFRDGFQGVVNIVLAVGEAIADTFQIAGLVIGLLLSIANDVFSQILQSAVTTFNEMGTLAKVALLTPFGAGAAIAQLSAKIAAGLFDPIVESAKLARADIETILTTDSLPNALAALGKRGGKILADSIKDQAVKDAPKIVDEVVETMEKKTPEFEQAGETFGQAFSRGAARGFDEFVDAARDASAIGEEFFTSTFNNLEDEILNFVDTGKFSFKDLANSIVKDIVKITLRGTLGDIGSVLGFGDKNKGQSFLGGLFGKGGTTPAAGAAGGVSPGDQAVVTANDATKIALEAAEVVRAQDAIDTKAKQDALAMINQEGFAKVAQSVSGAVSAAQASGAQAAAATGSGGAAVAAAANQATTGEQLIVQSTAAVTQAVEIASSTASTDAGIAAQAVGVTQSVLQSGFNLLAAAQKSGGGGGGGSFGGTLGGIVGAVGSLVSLGFAIAEIANEGGVAGSNPTVLASAGQFRNAAKFQKGGRVGTSGVDDIPALLTKGERVLTVGQNESFEAGVRSSAEGRNVVINQTFNLPNVRDARDFRDSEQQRSIAAAEALRRAEGRNA